MTTYLDIQTAGSHLFPIASPWKSQSVQSRFSYIDKLFAKIDSAIVEIQTKRALRALPDHLLRDIGVERYKLG